jgi:nitroreductase
MELTETIRRRRMVRAYDPAQPVPPDVVDLLLRNAIRAPSAGFSQGWDFLVLREPAARDRFWAATIEPGDQDSWLRGMQSAPLLIVCLSDKDRYLDRYAEPDKGWSDRDEARWPVPYWDVDAGMAAMLMLLTAVDQGLASCFFGIGPAQHDSFRSAFAIPANRTPVGVVSVGYAAPDRPSPSLRRGRRGLDEVAHDGRFGTPYVRPGSA